MRDSYCPICKKKVPCNDPPDIQKKILVLKRRRIKTCKFGAGKADIPLTKIEDRAKESHIPEDKIKKLLEDKDGKMLRWFFIKNPINQNYPETWSANYIKRMAEIKQNSFKNLPSKFSIENHRKWVIDGKVYTFREINKSGKAWCKPNSKLPNPNYDFECSFCSMKFTKEEKKKVKEHNKTCKPSSFKWAHSKSIDFEFMRNDYTFYVSHKHTREAGGGQEDFMRELKNFLTDANGSSREQKTIFLAIADGGFNKTKLEELRSEQSGLDSNNCSGSFALQIEVLPHFLKEHFN